MGNAAILRAVRDRRIDQYEVLPCTACSSLAHSPISGSWKGWPMRGGMKKYLLTEKSTFGVSSEWKARMWHSRSRAKVRVHTFWESIQLESCFQRGRR